VFDKMKSVDHVHTWLTVSHVATLSKPTTACTYCRGVTRGIGYQRTRLISVAGCTKNWKQCVSSLQVRTSIR